MWGQCAYGRCDKCGVATFDIANHVCDNAILVQQEVSKLDAEFEQTPGATHPVTNPDWRRFRWKPFDVWAATAQGRFELWYATRS